MKGYMVRNYPKIYSRLKAVIIPASETRRESYVLIQENVINITPVYEPISQRCEIDDKK